MDDRPGLQFLSAAALKLWGEDLVGRSQRVIEKGELVQERVRTLELRSAQLIAKQREALEPSAYLLGRARFMLGECTARSPPPSAS